MADDKWKDYKKKQKELADAAGYTQPGALGKFEQGVRQDDPKKDRFKKIKSMFGT